MSLWQNYLLYVSKLRPLISAELQFIPLSCNDMVLELQLLEAGNKQMNKHHRQTKTNQNKPTEETGK